MTGPQPSPPGRPGPPEPPDHAAPAAWAGRSAGRSRARSWLATVTPLLVVSAARSRSAPFSGRTVAKGRNGADQFWHGCFSDLPALYRIGNLQSGLGGYLSPTGDSATLDHPAATGAVTAFMGWCPTGACWTRPGGTSASRPSAAALVVATVFLTAASRPRHVADAAVLAASPLLVLVPLVSADTLGVAPTAAACGLGAAVSHSSPARCSALRWPRARTRCSSCWRWSCSACAPGGGRPCAAPSSALLPALARAAALPRVQPRGDHPRVCRVVALDAGLGSLWMVPRLLGRSPPSGVVTLLAVLGVARLRPARPRPGRRGAGGR